MSCWSDPQKGGRAVGAALYPTLSSILSTAPRPGMRATASDAPGSMLYEVGGKWGGSLGSVSQATLDSLTAGELAQLAGGIAGTTNLTPETLTFGSYAELSARGSSARIGVVDGVVYAWSESQGRMVAQALAPEPFDMYAAAVAAWPVGAYIGQTLRVKRIIGSGTYGIIWTGSRWAVGMAEAPVRLDAEVELTATGTAYVQVASAVVGPLIGNNETWLFRMTARNAGVYTASAGLSVRTTGSVATQGTAATLTGAGQRGRRIGAIRRSGGTIQRVTGQGESYSAQATSDTPIADWSTFAIEAGITPGGAGDTFRLEEFNLIREA